MNFRPTVRLRLTALYGGLFLIAGAVLLTLNYALVRRSLDNQGIGVRLEAPASEGSITAAPLFEPLVGPDQIVGPDGATVADVLRQYEVRVRDEALHSLVVQSGLALGVMALASVGLGWLVAGRALRPLQDVTSAARRLSKDNLHERLALAGPPDELKELADTFDAMLERLETAFDSQKRFVANASHELRTPLAIQRTLVDVTLADPDASPEELRAMAVSLREAVDRSERLIEGLLVLARAEQGQLPREPVDLAGVIRRALDGAASEAANAGLNIGANLATATVRANRVLIERLVANLVENAIRHNHAGGWIEVQTGASTGTAVVRVANSGPVVDPGDVDTLFQPFRRLGTERTGSYRGVGLGLSIVQAVTKAHNGHVRARALDGGGLEIVVEMDAVPAPLTPIEPGTGAGSASAGPPAVV